MNISEEMYENCQIQIEDGIRLFINQKEIEYDRDEDNEKWSSRYLPYTQYDSLGALARAIISDTAEFKT